MSTQGTVSMSLNFEVGPSRPNIGIWALVLLAGATASCAPKTAGPRASDAGSLFSAPTRPNAVVNGQSVPRPEILMGDPRIIAAIIREGRDQTQVMNQLTHLSQKIGPRLTGSSRVLAANNWCRDQYAAFGLSNPRLEQYGTIGVGFDRGPSSGKVLMREDKKGDDGATTSTYTTAREMQFSTLAWAAGTNGPVRGKVVWLPKDEEGYAAIKDELKGAWVLMEPPPPVGQRGIRSRMGASYEARKDAREKVAAGEDVSKLSFAQRVMFDGVAGFISTSRDERVWTGAVPGWRDLTIDRVPPDVHVSVRLSDYDFLNSRLADGEPIEVEFDLKHTFNAGPVPIYNTIADIVGSEKPDEYVIISGHLDTWDGPGSDGTTDNGTGTAVTLEAARILSRVFAGTGTRPKRTIRFINWTGEEQGLLGARGYLDQNKDLWPKISAAFVDDGGTNYQGGIPAASSMVPMLAAASAYVNGVFYSQTDGKYLDVNIRDTGAKIDTHSSSDHAAFNSVGIPGFFWDEVGRADYSFTWHTQNDKLSAAIPEYLVQSAVNSALVAYNLANAETLLPRVTPPPPPTPRAPAPAAPTAQPPASTPATTPAPTPSGG